MVSEERCLSGVAEFGPGPEGRICAGMQKLSRNANTAQECRSRVRTQKPSEMQKSRRNAKAGAECEKPGGHGDAVQARTLRVPSVPGAFVRMEAAGEFGSRRAAKAVSRRCAGLFAGIETGGDPPQKRPLRPCSGFFQGRVSTKGSAFPGDWLRDGERPRFAKRNFRKGAARRFFCARLKWEL